MAAAAVRQPIVGLSLAGVLLLAAAFAAPLLVPEADPADLITRQTARVAVLFWGLGAATLLLRKRVFARAAWTVGAAAFLVHVATAFEQIHGWSHAAAVRHVEAVSGIGAALFVSYAFTAAWTADAAWWWIDRHGYDCRPICLDRVVHAFLAFVVFNGTVVYETGFIRWAGTAVFTLLGILFFRRMLAGFVPLP